MFPGECVIHPVPIPNTYKDLRPMHSTIPAITLGHANPFWVFCFIGERPGGWAILGGLIVITAIFIRSVMSVSEKLSK